MSQTKHSSYKKLSSLLENSEDVFEVQILQRIIDDYQDYHENELVKFEELLAEGSIVCPECGSADKIRYGKHKNGTQRYRCRACGKVYNFANKTLFFSSKVNIKAWFAFLECILSGTSVSAACITAKISVPTGVEWMKKIFSALKDYQKDISLGNIVYIDETYVHEDESKIYLLEEVGKIKKVRKQPRGISRNKICILVATDENSSFAEIVCHGRPQRLKCHEICRRHIVEGTHLIGDEDNALTYTANQMSLIRTMIKSNTYEAYEKLKPVDQLCNRLKFFLNKHRGFKKDVLEDYLNLFIFIDNEKKNEKDLYIVTKKLIKMMAKHKKSDL